MKLHHLLMAPLLAITLNAFAEDVITGGDGLEASLQVGQPFTFADWNIHKEHGAGFLKEFGTLQKQSEIFCIQEVELDDATIAQWNALDTVKWFMASAWQTSNGPTGTAVLSKVKTDDVYAVISDKAQPVAATPKSSVVAYFPIAGSTYKLLVITTHALNFTGLGPFQNQLLEIAPIIEAHVGPVIWAGDFNTWNGGRHDYLFQLADSLGLTHVALDGDDSGDGLDHIFQKNLKVISASKLEEFVESDHKPLLAKFQFL